MSDETLSSIRKKIDLKMAFKTALVAGLGWTLGLWWTHQLDRPDTIVSGLWCAVSAIVVIQAYIGGTYKAAWTRFLGVVVGSILGGFWTTLLGSSPLSLSLSIFSTVIACSLLNLKESLRIACLSVTVVMVLWGLRPGVSPWTFAFFRAIDSTLGIMLAVTVAHLFWPSQATQKLRKNMAQIILLSHHAYRLITHIAASGDNKSSELFHLSSELDLLFHENSLILDEARMELITEQAKLAGWTTLQDQLQQLFYAIQALDKVHTQPHKMLDTSLSQQLATITNEVDNTLQSLNNKMLQKDRGNLPSELLIAQSNLQEDLLRFRATHTIRKFNFQEVESFYVFFYCFNQLIENIKKTDQLIDSINSPNTES